MKAAFLELEERWAKENQLDPEGMVVCSSGTAALHLALEVIREKGRAKEARVLLSEYTMIACARAITLAGLEPCFVDCRPDTLLIDLGLVRDISSRGDIVMPVHVYGRTVDMERLTEIANEKDLFIVEDLAEAHSIKPHPDTDAACWSFYKNKVVAGEEGGAVYFRDKGGAAYARSLRSLGFTEAHDFFHVPRGHNYRMSNAHALLILAHMYFVKMNLSLRRYVEGAYDKACPKPWRNPAREVPWVYDLRIPGLGADRLAQVVKALNAEGIEARQGFKAMSLQREYAPPDYLRTHKTNAELASEEVFYLPITPLMQIENVASRSFEIIRGIVPSP